jgi:hypothetical protein
MGKYSDAARRAVDAAGDADVEFTVHNPGNTALWLFLK